MLALRRAQSRARNRNFVRVHPDFPTPPEDLAFDAYNHVDWPAYREIGRKHAEIYARVIAEAKPEGPLKIFEWGCGPGRIIRHIRDCLPGREVELIGSDCNARSIDWCRSSIPGVQFEVNRFLPPCLSPKIHLTQLIISPSSLICPSRRKRPGPQNCSGSCDPAACW